MTVTTLLLDADGVVQTGANGWLDEVAGLCGVPGKEEAFLQAVFAAERPTLAGRGDFRRALADVLARWSSTSSVAEALKIWHLIEPQPPVLDRVTVLRARGVRVSLATNQQAERAQYMSECLGYQDLFDDLFYSFQLGRMKPDADYFSAVLDRLDQSGSEVLFVDDHPSNVDAARKAGMHAVVYDLASGPAGFHALLADYNL